MKAGKLRHRINIERKVETQDSSGNIFIAWESMAESISAAIEPLSAKEFVASQSLQSQIVARITIRNMDGLDASMRIVHNGKIYNPAGFLPDKISGLSYLTIPVSEGVNDG
jgi:SPP1 family predicted phage head-tail adaptor